MTRKEGVGLATFGAAVALAAAGGSVTGPSLWYQQLKKPPYQPPGWLFGPVWTGLYALMAVAGWRVWRGERSVLRRRALKWWGAQWLFNAAWSPLFFGRQRPDWALVDLLLVLASAGAFTKTASKVDRPAAWLFAPYLGWLSFAALLNEEIVRRNPPS